ncbi:macro domain-containing protein [Pedobacter sp. PWIIR3]
MIDFKTNNLLQADVEALVNAVNTVGIMGEGIALQFKEKFDLNYKIYKKACAAGEVVPGEMFVTNTNHAIGPKYIINFPTKTDWHTSTKLEYIESGLDDLIKVIEEKNIKSIAIPALGCGNGGLNWGVVKPLILNKLKLMEDHLNIQIFEPAGDFQADSKSSGRYDLFQKNTHQRGQGR